MTPKQEVKSIKNNDFLFDNEVNKLSNEKRRYWSLFKETGERKYKKTVNKLNKKIRIKVSEIRKKRMAENIKMVRNILKLKEYGH